MGLGIVLLFLGITLLALVVGFTAGVVVCAEFPKVFKLQEHSLQQLTAILNENMHWIETRFEDKIAALGTQVVEVGQNIHRHIHSVSRPVEEERAPTRQIGDVEMP